MGSKYFLYKKNPIYMGGNNENDKVASRESVPICLKLPQCFYCVVVVVFFSFYRVFYHFTREHDSPFSELSSSVDDINFVVNDNYRSRFSN